MHVSKVFDKPAKDLLELGRFFLFQERVRITDRWDFCLENQDPGSWWVGGEGLSPSPGRGSWEGTWQARRHSGSPADRQPERGGGGGGVQGAGKGPGWAGTTRTLTYRWRGRGRVLTWRILPRQSCVAQAKLCVTGKAGMRPRPQKDRRKGRSRQTQRDETQTHSSKFRQTEVQTGRSRQQDRQGLSQEDTVQATQTDRAGAPGTPTFLGALPGSSSLPWPRGQLRPAGPPALPRVQADPGRDPGSWVCRGGRWGDAGRGPGLLSRCISRISLR